MAWAFDYVKDHPLATEAEYQYAAKDMQCDTTKESKGKGEIYSYKHVRPHSSFALRQALAQGPVASAIEADTAAFELYKGGIITSDCGTTVPNHGILIVGYGTQDEQSFFLLKNTWGTNWGEQGYVRVGATDKNNVCAMLKGYDVIPFAKK
jgi:C1A family cysteine protease